MLDALVSRYPNDVMRHRWILNCFFINVYKEVMHSAPASHSESIPRSVHKAAHMKFLLNQPFSTNPHHPPVLLRILRRRL